MIVRKLAAEFFATFALVFTGMGAVVIDDVTHGGVSHVGVALTFGLIVLALIYAVGDISGCHINPAVTLGMVLTRRIGISEAAGYVVAQVVGAIAGAGLVLLIAGGAPEGYTGTLGSNGYGLNSPGHYKLLACFLTEALFTMLLVITVLGATDKKAPAGFAGIAIGLALTVTNLASIPITNASINPARSIGPAVFAGGWALQQLWLFIVAPLAGAALAALVYMAINSGETVPDAANQARKQTAA